MKKNQVSDIINLIASKKFENAEKEGFSPVYKIEPSVGEDGKINWRIRFNELRKLDLELKTQKAGKHIIDGGSEGFLSIRNTSDVPSRDLPYYFYLKDILFQADLDYDPNQNTFSPMATKHGFYPFKKEFIALNKEQKILAWSIFGAAQRASAFHKALSVGVFGNNLLKDLKNLTLNIFEHGVFKRTVFGATVMALTPAIYAHFTPEVETIKAANLVLGVGSLFLWTGFTFSAYDLIKKNRLLGNIKLQQVYNKFAIKEPAPVSMVVGEYFGEVLNSFSWGKFKQDIFPCDNYMLETSQETEVTETLKRVFADIYNLELKNNKLDGNITLEEMEIIMLLAGFELFCRRLKALQEDCLEKFSEKLQKIEYEHSDNEDELQERSKQILQVANLLSHFLNRAIETAQLDIIYKLYLYNEDREIFFEEDLSKIHDSVLRIDNIIRQIENTDKQDSANSVLNQISFKDLCMYKITYKITDEYVPCQHKCSISDESVTLCATCLVEKSLSQKEMDKKDLSNNKKTYHIKLSHIVQEDEVFLVAYNSFRKDTTDSEIEEE